MLKSFPVHVVAFWMGHDAKVGLKHYAQTTEDHFDRAAGAAKSGAQAAQNPAQQIAAGNRREWNESPQSEAGEAFSASPCDSLRHAAFALAFSGEGGIRTPETGLPRLTV